MILFPVCWLTGEKAGEGEEIFTEIYIRNVYTIPEGETLMWSGLLFFLREGRRGRGCCLVCGFVGGWPS